MAEPRVPRSFTQQRTENKEETAAGSDGVVDETAVAARLPVLPPARSVAARLAERPALSIDLTRTSVGEAIERGRMAVLRQLRHFETAAGLAAFDEKQASAFAKIVNSLRTLEDEQRVRTANRDLAGLSEEQLAAYEHAARHTLGLPDLATHYDALGLGQEACQKSEGDLDSQAVGTQLALSTGTLLALAAPQEGGFPPEVPAPPSEAIPPQIFPPPKSSSEAPLSEEPTCAPGQPGEGGC